MKYSSYLAFGLVAGVAAAHLYFMYVEMSRWASFSVEIAGLAKNVAESTTEVGRNQGLYNGFLAAGLIWSLFAPAPFDRWLAVFFLGCVLVAGVFGQFTIKPPSYLLLKVQALPAALALIALWASGGVMRPKLSTPW